MASNDIFGERYTWNTGHLVQFWDKTKSKWYNGKIKSITIDEEGEWLNISDSHEQFQRWSPYIRPQPPTQLRHCRVKKYEIIDNKEEDHFNNLQFVNETIRNIISGFLKTIHKNKMYEKRIENIITIYYYDFTYIKHISEILMEKKLFNAYNIHYGNYIPNLLYFFTLDNPKIRNNPSLILRFIHSTQQSPPILTIPLIDKTTLIVPSNTTYNLTNNENVFTNVILLPRSKIVYKCEKKSKNKDNKLKICVSNDIVMQSHSRIEFDTSEFDLELPCIYLEAKNGIYMNRFARMDIVTKSNNYINNAILTVQNKKEMIAKFDANKRKGIITIKCKKLKVDSDALFGRGCVVILDINTRIDDIERIKELARDYLCELIA